jgi:predicted nucleic acid-binding protein
VTLVIDASVVVAALADSGRDGGWAAAVFGRDELVAPHLMPFEAANILRRAALAGDITPCMPTTKMLRVSERTHIPDPAER